MKGTKNSRLLQTIVNPNEQPLHLTTGNFSFRLITASTFVRTKSFAVFSLLYGVIGFNTLVLKFLCP